MPAHGSIAPRLAWLRLLVLPAATLCLLTACGGGGSASAAAGTGSPGASGASANGSSSGTSSTSGTSATSNAAAPVIKVAGNRFVDGNGTPVQMRGVNVSGLEFVAMGGWDPGNPWGAQTGTTSPDWKLIAGRWHANVVRLPLNESAWLQRDLGNCIDDTKYSKLAAAAGALVNADPGNNYRETVQAAVDGATAAGLMVILDLHWTAPMGHCATAQDTFLGDHSVAFWTSVASQFKGYRNVIFEAFNEPYADAMTGLLAGGATWKTAMAVGATANYFIAGSSQVHEPVSFAMPSWQAVLNAIRATGAANPVLIGSPTWTGDLSHWADYAPVDRAPAGYTGSWTPQVAAAWHTYPKFGATFGSAQYQLINNTTDGGFTAANMVAASVPVLITEYGDQDSAGTTSAPFAAMLLPAADAAGMGYVAWTFDVWGNPSNVLIINAAGDPTPGFGVYVLAHYTCRAGSSASCP